MKIPKTARITNYGVFNTGEVHGNVVNTINHAFENKRDDQTAQLRDALVALADEISRNAKEMEKPDEALRRVQQTAEEVASGNADKGVVLSYLDRILTMAGKIPSVAQAVLSVKSMVGHLF